MLSRSPILCIHHKILLSLALIIGITARYEYTAQAQQTITRPASDQNNKIAPKTDMSRALLRLNAADTKAHMEANILSLEEMLTKYGTKDPWASKAFYLLGYTRYKLGRHEQALPDFESCLKLPEPHIGIHFSAENMRIMILKELGRYKEAIAASKELEKHPAPPGERDKFLSNNYMLRAEMQAQIKGQEKSAVGTYKELLEHIKSKKGEHWQAWTPYAYRALADQLIKIGKIKEAIHTYNQFLEEYPEDPASALIAMKKLRLIKCSKPECLLSYNEILSCMKKYSTNTGAGQHVLYELASACSREGKLEEAADILKGIMNFKPKPNDREYSVSLAAGASLALAGLLEELGKERERKETLEEIIRRFPNSPEAQIAKQLLHEIRIGLLRRYALVSAKVGLLLVVVFIAVYIGRRRRQNAGILDKQV